MEVSLADFSRKMHVNHSAVQKAIKTGRITAYRVEKKGRQTRVFVDLEKGQLEYLSTTDPAQRFSMQRIHKPAIPELPIKAPQASKIDPELFDGIDCGEALKVLMPDFDGLLASIRTMAKTLAQVPAEYQGYALSEAVGLLVFEFTQAAIEELKKAQGRKE